MLTVGEIKVKHIEITGNFDNDIWTTNENAKDKLS